MILIEAWALGVQGQGSGNGTASKFRPGCVLSDMGALPGGFTHYMVACALQCLHDSLSYCESLGFCTHHLLQNSNDLLFAFRSLSLSIYIYILCI